MDAMCRTEMKKGRMIRDGPCMARMQVPTRQKALGAEIRRPSIGDRPRIAKLPLRRPNCSVGRRRCFQGMRRT